jgi:4-deoxy-L-threo-5-hexosulose-uronate ketol-isomerase
MEVYFYFDVHPDHRVIHLMGQPQETTFDRCQLRSSHFTTLVNTCRVRNRELLFYLGMAGENYTYTDMDGVAISELR